MNVKTKFIFLIVATLTFLEMKGQIGFESFNVVDTDNLLFGLEQVDYGDMDGDGDLDVLASSNDDRKIVWFENLDNQDNYSQAKIINSSSVNSEEFFTLSSIFSDLDGDGDLDVLSTYNSENLIWFENEFGTGTFKIGKLIPIEEGRVNYIYAEDLDGDGLDDLIVVQNSGYSKWYKNGNNASFFEFQQAFRGHSGAVLLNTECQFGDLDNDGDLDILFSISNSTLLAWARNDNGFFEEGNLVGNFGAFGRGHSIIADLDNDGDLDIAAIVYISFSNNKRVAWFENVNGNFDLTHEIGTGFLTNFFLAEDIDGDGNVDLIFDDFQSEISWFKNVDGLGSFQREVLCDIEYRNAIDPRFLDIDEDGDFDLIAGHPDGDFISWHENEDGLFGDTIMHHYISPVRRAMKSGVFSDLDGDDDLDGLVCYTHSIVSPSNLIWYKNINGTGEEFEEIIIDQLEGRQFLGAITADFDQDGDDDILCHTSFVSFSSPEPGKRISWYENLDGNATFGSENILEVLSVSSPNILDLNALDVDGDSDLDILVTFSGNDFFVEKVDWMENDDGSFGALNELVPLASNSAEYKFADLDNDNDVDILVGRSSGVYVLDNVNGESSFQATNIEPISSGGFSYCTEASFGDIDDDGLFDILYVVGERQMFWKKNLSDGNYGEPILITDTLDIREVVTGDIDLDGDIDLVISGNQDVYWMKNIDGLGIFDDPEIISFVNASIDLDDVDNNGFLDAISFSKAQSSLIWHKNSGYISNEISGYLKFDFASQPCQPDGLPLGNIVVSSEQNGQIISTLSLANGFYSLYIEEGECVTTISSEVPEYFVPSPDQYINNFSGLGNFVEQDFCFEAIQSVKDISLAVFPLEPAMPGFEVDYQIVYENNGSVVLDGSFVLEFPGQKMSYLGSSQIPSDELNASLSFDYASLLPGEKRVINVSFLVDAPPTNSIGDVLILSIEENSIVDDIQPENNQFILEHIVIGSFDPNDISVLEGDEVLIQNKSNYLHYLIRFQNTGTSEAINVNIEQDLDLLLDWRTLKVESTSHDNVISIINGQELLFSFDDINLPDSTSNLEGSNGYLIYKIKPLDSVVLGDNIESSARIYFDFNIPVLTNEVNTEFVIETSVMDLDENIVQLWPNPVSDRLYIAPAIDVKSINIINQLGQILLRSKSVNEISVSGLMTGTYYCEVTGTNGRKKIAKFIKI